MSNIRNLIVHWEKELNGLLIHRKSRISCKFGERAKLSVNEEKAKLSVNFEIKPFFSSKIPAFS